MANRFWLGLVWLPLLSGQGTSKPPQTAPPDAWGTKTIQVKYVDPEQLRRLFSGQSYVMEADRDLMALIVHGPATFLKEVEDTVKQFDVAPAPPPNIQLTVYLLAAGEQASSPGTLPPELAAIAKELKTAGSQTLQLADCQMVRVRAGQAAEAMGSEPSSPAAASLSRVRLEFATTHPGPKGDSISLDGLRVWLNVPSGLETPRVEPKNGGDVIANIDVVPNQPVLLAETGIDKPLAVVVRATVIH